jgi:zinc protease
MRALAIGLAALGLLGCGARSTPDGDPLEGRAVRLPGLSAFTAEMVRHGAGERSTEQIAEEIEFVGGDLWIESEADYSTIQTRVLSDQLEVAVELLADLAQRPTFPSPEIEKVRRREIDRLSLMAKRPEWLASRELMRGIYGEIHPYGQFDADPAAIARLERSDLVSFHGAHYVPRNAFLVVAGDVTPDQVRSLAERHFGAWEDRPPPSHEIAPAPELPGRRVVVVDRPGSTQAQVAFGNASLGRSSEDYIPLRVANIVLGGTASARLFLNLRERCGYGYGAYSGVESYRGQAPISASGAFDANDTAGALRELFSELERIVSEPPPPEELRAARDYLDGVFPMLTETASNLARLVTIQRVFDLPEDYWSHYRSSIQWVTADTAHGAARRYIRPDQGVLVVVGDASRVAWPARRYGDVRIVSPEGIELGTLRGAPEEWPGGEPEACPSLPEEEADGEGQGVEPPRGGTPRDFDFPDVDRAVLENGLEILTVRQPQLPLASVGLVVLSGSASDPL